MISTKQTKTSSNALTPPKPKSSTHVADPNSAPAYADQSSSRLMTLPKEIRNDIYTYVFCDNIDRVNAPIKYDREGKAVMADAPAPVHLVRFLPPPKESILACRQLYSEMKGMYTAAYRAYWSDNWFICNARQFLPNSEYPPDKDMQHIRHFCLLLRLAQECYLHLVFQGGEWECSLLPVDGRVLAFHDLDFWLDCECFLKSAVAACIASIPVTWDSFDPREGRGLTWDMILVILNDKLVNTYADSLYTATL
jgi:hypothetical protein